jgi:hypothetical protein
VCARLAEVFLKVDVGRVLTGRATVLAAPAGHRERDAKTLVNLVLLAVTEYRHVEVSFVLRLGRLPKTAAVWIRSGCRAILAKRVPV